MALTNCLKIVELYQTFQKFKTKPLNLKTIINLNNLVSFKVLSNKRFNSSNACDDSSDAILKNSLNEQNVSILLKLPGKKITLTTLLKAKQLSASKDMKLVKIIDSNENSKPFYKLISITDESKKNSEFKVSKKQNIKHMYISANICDHDLKIKIKSMTGFLEKNCKVTLSINAVSNPSKLTIQIRILIHQMIKLTKQKEIKKIIKY
ncbi:PREDICTED: uncharacterized protein LOC105364594 [Ceratosolen solmsi marchali]|uniref:Uncharacterized protein LOC105364594 n=1 Tax=Ceratosolen solmsi marchali TaxID=326594 RepID=A0AAJ6YMN7_9HYME|nr:PREDICTED: uncharacterized protein LOC105364594 [Ceratosolen solmsi marchali]